ncbi:Kelch-like protein [Melia azedarach]|uniref:Kelch-like protein n=1 Tax=Melia azedarach TaxID=155640 RepID=A0ACC1WZ61_MELAZ|nr:Kelch-like protein [Melia azedarach]
MGERNTHASARNLQKSDLGGVIFGCKNNTINECLSKQLFGLPSQHFLYVRKIDPGLPLFLFNYSDRKLHGIFESASPGRLNINPYGWTDGKERTQYPAQVQIRVRLQCQPVLEEKFKPLILANYYTNHHFWFELDHAQTRKLMSLLASLAIAPSTYIPWNTANQRKVFPPLPTSDKKEEGNRFKLLALDVECANFSSGASDSSDAAFSADGAREEDEFLQPSALEIERSNNHGSRKSDSSNFASFDGDDPLLKGHLDMNLIDQDEKGLILMKLKELAFNNEHRDFSSTGHVNKPAVERDMHFEDLACIGEKMSSEEKNEEIPCSSSHCQVIITELVREMEELKAFKTEQTLRMKYLEQMLVEAETEIQRLKDHCIMVESASSLTMEHKDEKVESSDKWLSTLDLYFPRGDVRKSLKPMNCVRSYASTSLLNGELYISGGGDGQLWYNTVESYNPTNDQWTLRPSLNGSKGSLAGATVNNKIFAIGGGNGVDCFSEVEMLDLDIGQWIRTRSMLRKRFALAAAELNGVLYASGGYDGNDYMSSVERFDPREHYWTRIASMNTRRGCHSLVVLDGKLYALGGFDGSAMVPSIEIYDPRLGSWMSGEPMKHSRGYLAAAVVKESIYVIGGVKIGDEIVDTVERFKESQGWEEINSRAIGKRCFMSAITL